MDTLKNLLVQEAKLSSQMQAMGDSLSEVRVRIAEVRNHNRNAGTYNLPTETLSAIFEAEDRRLDHIPSQHTLLHQREGGPRVPLEIILSSVSRRWRNVALQTPRLWTSINIKVANSTRDLYDLYLHRSKLCLLDIMLLNFIPTKELHNDSKLKEHLGRLIPHVARWRTFIIRKGHIESPSSVLSILTPLCAPALETLVLDLYCSEGPIVTLFSAGASRLSSLELKGSFIRIPVETVKYMKLLSLIEGGITYNQFRQLMVSMHSLTHLCMDSNVVGESTNYPLIEIPSLLSLDYRHGFLGTSGVGDLRILDMPSLETLTIHRSRRDIITVLAEHHRLYPLVQSFTLASDYNQKNDIPVATVLDFISLFPDIRDVTFQGDDPTPVLNALHSRLPDDELLWPHLSSITIVPSERTKVALKKQIWVDVIKLVANRSQLGSPILTITLSSDVVERGTQRQLRRLREQVDFVER